MNAAPLNMEKYGLQVAVASLFAVARRKGMTRGDEIASFVLETLQGLTLVEIRDLLQSAVMAVHAAKDLPADAQSLAFTHELQRQVGP